MKTELHILSDTELYSLFINPKVCHQAFKEIYHRYEHKVWAYCRITLGNDEKARDAVQESFVRFFRIGQKGAKIENIGAYLMRIVRNVCLDEKKHTAQNPLLSEDFELPVFNDEYERKELGLVIDAALHLLSDDQKEALLLQTFSDMTYSEIAELQDVPLSTVRNRIVRAKRKLKEILTPYFSYQE